MKVQILREDFILHLAAAHGVAALKTTIPILSHVLIQARGDELTLTTTDLDQTLVCTLEAEVLREGGLCVPVKKFKEIIGALPAKSVVYMETSGAGANMPTLDIAAVSAKFSLQGFTAQDFPSVPSLADAKTATVPAAAIRRLVAGVSDATSEEQSRFQLSGALLVFGEDRIEAVATDGHRLALVVRSVPGLGDDLDGVTRLVHKRALAAASHLDGGDITISLTDDYIGFAAGGRQLLSRRLEGSFPDYRRVIAKGNKKRPVFDREELLAAVSRVRLMTGERAATVKLALEEDLATLSTRSSDQGAAEESVACEYDGGALVIGINPDYLATALRSFGTKQVRLEMQDANTQMVIFAHGEDLPAEDLEALCVVMPLRI